MNDEVEQGRAEVDRKTEETPRSIHLAIASIITQLQSSDPSAARKLLADLDELGAGSHAEVQGYGTHIHDMILSVEAKLDDAVSCLNTTERDDTSIAAASADIRKRKR